MQQVSSISELKSTLNEAVEAHRLKSYQQDMHKLSTALNKRKEGSEVLLEVLGDIRGIMPEFSQNLETFRLKSERICDIMKCERCNELMRLSMTLNNKQYFSCDGCGFEKEAYCKVSLQLMEFDALYGNDLPGIDENIPMGGEIL